MKTIPRKITQPPRKDEEGLLLWVRMETGAWVPGIVQQGSVYALNTITSTRIYEDSVSFPEYVVIPCERPGE